MIKKLRYFLTTIFQFGSAEMMQLEVFVFYANIEI